MTRSWLFHIWKQVTYEENQVFVYIREKVKKFGLNLLASLKHCVFIVKSVHSTDSHNLAFIKPARKSGRILDIFV